jgi:alpha-beta hydrolase superfamily lysophospholipase
LARHDDGFLSSRDGTRLYFRSLRPDAPPLGQVAILHGFGDHSGRYLEVMEALVARGLSTIAVDYRGHGKADGRRTDCRRWDEYLDDLEAFWRKALAGAAGAPTFLLAHSHGALMATHWAALAPPGLQGLLLSSPFYALAFAPPRLKLLGARLVRGLLPTLPLGNELTSQMLTRDPARQRAADADPLYVRTITPRWFFECRAAQARLEGLGPRISVPVWMGAGTADPVVSTARSAAFFETLASPDRSRKEYHDFRHELWNELGRERVLDDIAQWILAHR